MFLDRDGVLNTAPTIEGRAVSPLHLEDFVVTDGASRQVARLAGAGFVTIVVSNQPDVARGRLPISTLEAMHQRLVAETGVDAVRFCPHDNADGCRCRKPRPGMLLDAAAAFGLSLADSWMVGDRWVDLAAGTAAGVRPVLLETPTSWAATSSGSAPDDLRGFPAFPTLGACVDHILAVS